jgi:hypothetical protein
MKNPNLKNAISQEKKLKDHIALKRATLLHLILLRDTAEKNKLFFRVYAIRLNLWAKAITYLLQDRGHDTYEANSAIGLPEDSRDFSDAALEKRFLLQGRPIQLLSNNPDKKAQLEENGQRVSKQVSLIAGICEHNKRYLEAKRDKGHKIDDGL